MTIRIDARVSILMVTWNHPLTHKTDSARKFQLSAFGANGSFLPLRQWLPQQDLLVGPY